MDVVVLYVVTSVVVGLFARAVIGGIAGPIWGWAAFAIVAGGGFVSLCLCNAGGRADEQMERMWQEMQQREG